MRETNKENINSIINKFQTIKDSIVISEKNLKKFDQNKIEDVERLTYVNGTGGYYVKFLNYIIKELKPKKIVELGNFTGLSTLSIYDAIETYDTSLTTIDSEVDQRYCPEAMYSDSKVKFIYGDVFDADVIKSVPMDIDFIFTDTVHDFEQISSEFSIYKHLLADKAIVAIDDIHLNDKGKFWDTLKYDKWDLTELCHVSGWGLFIYDKEGALTNEERLGLAIEAASKVWQNKYTKLLKVQNKIESRKLSNIAKSAIKNNRFIYNIILKSKKIINK